MSARKILAAASALAMALLLGACAGYPLPLSGQAGSTILIPLEGMYGAEIGYGSSPNDTIDPTPITDPQRGTMLYQLNTSPPFDLVTRATSVMGTYPTSKVDINGSGLPWQVVSMVDIPANAPLGTFGLLVTHSYTDPATGNPATKSVGYQGQITILPHSITFTNSSGVSQTVTGQSTPFAKITCNSNGCSPTDESGTLQNYLPSPAFWLDVKVPSGSNKPWGADITLTYPSSVITVSDVLENKWFTRIHNSTVWHTDDGSGTLTIHAAASTQQLQYLDVVFSLVDAASHILDPASITITQVKAWDQNGVVIPGATVTVAGIN